MRRWLAVVVLCLAGLCVRLPLLDATGLSEDEMDKLNAADAYDHGRFAVDGEHPALMKLAVYASLKTATRWNNAVPAHPMSTETAVRAPNAIAGALIAVVLFLLVDSFFGAMPALFAAWIWTFDVSAIAINRIAKEDTFALLFLLLAAWCYERGKRVGLADPRNAQRWFGAAGAAFGLMLASKYVPYLLGMHALYFKFADPHPGRNRPDKHVYLGSMAAAFMVANFPVMMPGNWSTIITFLREQAITHSGYVFQGQLWANKLSASPFGLPPWFYAAQFSTKIAVPVLCAAVLGAIVLVRSGKSRGAAFVATFAVLIFIPCSLVATKFLRYMLPMLAMIDIAAGVGLAWIVAAAVRSFGAARMAAAAAAGVVLAASATAAFTAHPFAGLYRNGVGRTLSPQALWFPPDELYDAGLREATARIAAEAPRGARIVTEAPNVVGYYAAASGRRDLVITRPAADDLNPNKTCWFIVQEGRRYFENESLIERVRQRPESFRVNVRDFPAVEVYEIPAVAHSAHLR